MSPLWLGLSETLKHILELHMLKFLSLRILQQRRALRLHNGADLDAYRKTQTLKFLGRVVQNKGHARFWAHLIRTQRAEA